MSGQLPNAFCGVRRCTCFNNKGTGGTAVAAARPQPPGAAHADPGSRISVCYSTLDGTLTAATAAPYIDPMPQDNTRELLAQELVRLESRIQELAEVCAKLRRDNHSLSERLESLSTERAGLLAKNEHVRGRVEAIITRLKSLEESA